MGRGRGRGRPPDVAMPAAAPSHRGRLTLSTSTAALHTGHARAELDTCIQRHRHGQQNRCPQSVTTGSLARSRQTLHSNTRSAALAASASDGAAIIAVTIAPPRERERRAGDALSRNLSLFEVTARTTRSNYSRTRLRARPGGGTRDRTRKCTRQLKPRGRPIAAGHTARGRWERTDEAPPQRRERSPRACFCLQDALRAELQC